MSSETFEGPDWRVQVERPATGGAIGHLADGRVIFVRHSLPGELVDVEITETTSNFSRGDARTIVEASPERVAPPCTYARPGGCGGCDLQHASPVAQSEWKSAIVAGHLARIAGIDVAVEVSSTDQDPRGSRTRLRCAVNEEGQLCLRASRSHELVAIDACWIAAEAFAEAFSTLWDGALEVELRAIGDGDPFAVVKRDTHRGVIYELCSLRGEPLEPSTQSRVAVRGHVYSVSPRSFWQSHRSAPEVLVDSVVEFSGLQPGDHVVDLFSGVGLLTIPLATIVGPRGKVTAVESSPYAVRDARQNGDGLAQLKVREWSVTTRSINDVVAKDDVVVLDPPRSGLGKGVAATLIRRAPRRIVYVSCDAATFARDLRTLSDGGFSLRELRVFDLFPMTEHVELVALLDNDS